MLLCAFRSCGRKTIVESKPFQQSWYMTCSHLHPHMQGPICGRCNEHFNNILASLLSLAATPFSLPTITDAPSVDKPDNLLPGPSQRLEPVIKCRPFLSFFQRYIVRDIPLSWDMSLARYFFGHWNLIRHFEKHEAWRTVKRKIIAFWGTTRFPTFTMH